jgi:hypothetical protein
MSIDCSIWWRRTGVLALLLGALCHGCGKPKPAAIPPPEMPDASSILSADADLRTPVAEFPRHPFEVGDRVSMARFSLPDTVPLTAATSPRRRWYTVDAVILDSIAAETLFVVTERFDAMGGDGALFLVHDGRVALRLQNPILAAPDGSLSTLLSFRTRSLPVQEGRALLLVREESVRTHGERYRAFGVRRGGSLEEFTGALEHVKDEDVPSSLYDGQVFYTRVHAGCFAFLLPITLDLRNARFVAEMGDDAIFRATGEGTPQLEGNNSLTFPLFLHPQLDARQHAVTVTTGTAISAVRCYVPSFVFGRDDPRFATTRWLQVRIDSLEGWIPDTLFAIVGFRRCL